MFSKIIILVQLIHTTKCSLVIDSLGQKELYVSDYCPKMKYCAEGAHVMCMYYNPNQIMGPRCSNPKNVSITPELATKLLDVSNAVRSKIALGKEKGKGGEFLPRGYGIFRLKWDDELATFAQVLANQCVLRHDMCRASKRFPDPGQTAGLVRFSYPDWYPVSKAGHFTSPGLNVPKMIYATTQALKSWYGQKNSVTIDMITTYPDWTENPNNQGGRLYLEMIYGPATHIGCGISAYTEYAYYDNNAPLNYNSIQIICNYSSRPRKNGMVYNTTAPVTSDFTARCGCPLGSIEDDDCLCHEEVKTHTTPLLQPIRKCLDGSCDPTVVLLPIFTVEDAPPNKLLTLTRNNNTATRRQNSLEIDIFHEPEKHELSHSFHRNLINHNNKKYQNTATSRLANTNSFSKISKKRIYNVKNRHFDKIPHLTLSRYQRTPSFGTLTDHPQKKQSLFSRQTSFMLPTNNKGHLAHYYKPLARKSIMVKKDVQPRKDFSNAQKLVNKYLEKNKYLDQLRTSQLNMHKDKYDEVFLPNHEILHNNIHEKATETILHTSEDQVMNFNQYLRNKNFTSVTVGKETEDSDRRLMILLDNLEKEVKNIELHGSEKKIFDAKIRKIYGKVVGKPDNLVEAKPGDLNKDYFYDSSKETKDDFRSNRQIFNKYNKNEIIDDRKVKNHLKELHNINDEPYDKYSDFEYNRRPVSRNQNTITDNERQTYYNDYNRQKILSSYEDLISYGRYNDDIKMRNTFEEGLNKERFNEIPKRSIKKQRTWDTHDDPLSSERRKYYQDKLENLQRRLQNTRSYKRRTELENNKQTRRIRPTDDYHKRRGSSKKQIDPFYMPERARFLHSF